MKDVMDLVVVLVKAVQDVEAAVVDIVLVVDHVQALVLVVMDVPLHVMDVQDAKEHAEVAVLDHVQEIVKDLVILHVLDVQETVLDLVQVVQELV